jgi:hypothetical protein
LRNDKYLARRVTRIGGDKPQDDQCQLGNKLAGRPMSAATSWRIPSSRDSVQTRRAATP